MVMVSGVGRPGLELVFESHFRPHLRILQWQRRASCWQMGSLDAVDFVLGLQGSLPQAGLGDDLHIQAVWCSVCHVSCFKMGLMGVTSGTESALFLLDSPD